MAPTRRTRRPTLALVAMGVVAVVALSLVPGSAAADPEPTLQQVQRQVAALHHEAEQASERANLARVRLDEVNRRLRSVQRRLARQQAAMRDVQRQVGEFAAASYKSGGADPALQLVLSDDPEAFLSQMSALDALSRRQSDTLRRMAAARQQLAGDRRAVAQQRSRAAELRDQLAAEKQTLDAKVARAESLLSTLEAEQRARVASAAHPATPRASRSGSREASPAPTYNGPASGRAAVAVRAAYAQLGDPYAYGGTGPNSFDCSGLTSYVWGKAGVYLPHSSSAQYSSGRKISSSALQPGDLVFYYSPISHVGIYIGGGRLIHAPYPGRSVEIVGLYSMPYSGAVRP